MSDVIRFLYARKWYGDVKGLDIRQWNKLLSPVISWKILKKRCTKKFCLTRICIFLSVFSVIYSCKRRWPINIINK